MELDSLTYNILLRDAICIKLMETDGGKEYLRECYRLQQEEPDYQAIKLFNKKMEV